MAGNGDETLHSPSPRPSPPGEGESSSGFGRYEHTQFPSRIWSDDQQRGDCNDDCQIDQRRQLALPLPGGEGRGEGGRSSHSCCDSHSAGNIEEPGKFVLRAKKFAKKPVYSLLFIGGGLLS